MYKLCDYTIPPIFKANCAFCMLSKACSCRTLNIQVLALGKEVSISVCWEQPVKKKNQGKAKVKPFMI